MYSLCTAPEQGNESVGESYGSHECKLHHCTDKIVGYRHSLEKYCNENSVEQTCNAVRDDQMKELRVTGIFPNTPVNICMPKYKQAKSYINWNKSLPGSQILCFDH
jgi:hypothetical protein